MPIASSRRRTAPVGALAVLLLLSGCARDGAETPPPPSTVPVAEGQWEAMPAAPLSPRGATTALWTGGQLLVLGGLRTDGEIAPRPAAASCSPPPTTALGDGAAWDPAARAWTHLSSDVPDDPGGYSRLSGHPAGWAGRQALTRSTAITPDVLAETLSVTSFDPGPGLVYADPVWTGDRLVLVAGASSAPGSGEANLVQAEVYDPATGEARSPLGGSGVAPGVGDMDGRGWRIPVTGQGRSTFSFSPPEYG